eukprot:s2134_g3.t1
MGCKPPKKFGDPKAFDSCVLMFPATEDPVQDPIRCIDRQKVLPVEPFIKDKPKGYFYNFAPLLHSLDFLKMFCVLVGLTTVTSLIWQLHFFLEGEAGSLSSSLVVVVVLIFFVAAAGYHRMQQAQEGRSSSRELHRSAAKHCKAKKNSE